MPRDTREIREEDGIRLRHMLDAAKRARRFCLDRTPDDLVSDEMLLFATVKAVEVIGEASTKVSAPTQTQLATIDWIKIRQMRNRMIHGYDTIDFRIVWDTVQDDLPQLIAQLEVVLTAWPSPESGGLSNAPNTV